MSNATDTCRALAIAARFAREGYAHDGRDAARERFLDAIEPIPTLAIRRAIAISAHASMRAHRYAFNDGVLAAMMEIAFGRGALVSVILLRGEPARLDLPTSTRRAVQ